MRRHLRRVGDRELRTTTAVLQRQNCQSGVPFCVVAGRPFVRSPRGRHGENAPQRHRGTENLGFSLCLCVSVADCVCAWQALATFTTACRSGGTILATAPAL